MKYLLLALCLFSSAAQADAQRAKFRGQCSLTIAGNRMVCAPDIVMSSDVSPSKPPLYLIMLIYQAGNRNKFMLSIVSQSRKEDKNHAELYKIVGGAWRQENNADPSKDTDFQDGSGACKVIYGAQDKMFLECTTMIGGQPLILKFEGNNIHDPEPLLRFKDVGEKL